MPDPSPIRKDAEIVVALTSLALRIPPLSSAVPSVIVVTVKFPAL